MTSAAMPSPVRRSRVGLSAKLYLAIGGAVAITLAASIVAWISFVELGQHQRRITREHIPSITDSLRLAGQSNLIAATAPALISATSEAERAAVIDALAGQAADLRVLIERLSSEVGEDPVTGRDRALIDEIGKTSTRLTTLLDQLDGVMGRKLAVHAELSERIARGAKLHRSLVEQLTPLLDDATLYLATGYRSLNDRAPQPAMRFSERTILTYAAMSQLSIEANLIGLLLAEATDLEEAALIPPLVERFQSASDRFDRAIEVIGPGGLQSVQETATALVDLGLGPDNVFELRRQLLEASDEADAIVAEARSIAAGLTTSVNTLVDHVQTRTVEAVAASNRAIDVGETLLLTLNAVSIIGAFLIGWGYVRRQITAPVVRITGAAAAFEAGTYDPESLAGVRQRGDELGDLARTFTVMAAEVQARTEILDRLVAERTRELNDKNALLEAANERMDAELSIARSLQAAMLPQRIPDNPRYAGKATMVPAREMGGDFYDFFSLGQNRIGLVIADVSGKGVPAAFFMAISRTILQGSARDVQSAGACLAATNDLLCEQNPLELFVTAFYGILDLDTGTLTYANAGHNPPLLAPQHGPVSPIPATGGVAMGVMPGLGYAENTIRLNPGDTIVLYTDGISEAMDRDGHEFTEGRLIGSLTEAHRESVEIVMSSVIDAVSRFVGDAPQSDDITCLVIRYRGPPPAEGFRDAAE
ncbi:MAG: SpoIIE family protein phosphatase [Rhizobiales bacterium]|nr:SpoIIE family protein phosphatase [Hyphomicrobiales bacterium]